MGKISMDRESKKGSRNPMELPPMQTLKPLPEIVTIPDSPDIASVRKVKKYVSPLSLTWKRKSPIPDKLPKRSPAKVANDCQVPATSSTITSHPGVAPTTQIVPSSPLKSIEPDKQENGKGGVQCSRFSRLSEGAFNISRIAATSTPIVSKKLAIDDAGFKNPNVYSEASVIPRKNRKSKKKKKTNQNMDDASPVNNVGQSLENRVSSCIIIAENVQEKEKNESGKKRACSPQEKTSVKPCEIVTIDLDITNEIINNHDKSIKVLSINTLSKKPVEIVDLSCTQDAVSAPITDSSVIVIDDDDPYEIQRSKHLAKTAKEERKDRKKNKLLQLQPHPGLMKKKNRQKKKGVNRANGMTQMPSTLGQDDVCFLGTGISFRPPKPTAIIDPGVNRPSASAGSSAQNPGPSAIPPSSIYGSNFDNPNSNVPQTGLRPIVIDGSNVAMGHGIKEKVFSSKGLEICVNYFLKRGHKVYCFIPQFRKSDPFTKDRHILTELEEQGHLICTPSRYVGSNAIVPYDDRYIVQIAAELGGVIISRDNYRDLIAENPVFKETIQKRTLMFTWVGDILMFPNDPFGRSNVSLDSMLRF